MKSWRYLTIVSVLFLTACTAKPDQVDSVSFDNCSTSPQGFICPNLPAPTTTEDWEKCRRDLAEKMRPIYERFPNDLDAALAASFDSRIREQLNSELSQCLIALDDSMAPMQDAYYSSLILIKHIKRYKIQDKFAKLLALLEEMNQKTEPLVADPKNIDDYLGFYGEYLKRSIGNLAIQVSDSKEAPSESTLNFDKAALSCAFLASSYGEDKQILASAQQAMDLLKKVKAEGKYSDFLIRSFGTALSKIICRLDPSNKEQYLDISFAVYERSAQNDNNADSDSKQSGQNATAPASKSGQSNQKKGASTPSEKSPVAAQQPSEPKAMSLTPSVGQEITTPSGLRITITSAGAGPACKINDTVSIHYTGKLLDGTVFDSSYERHHPLTFPLGQGYVIDGWEAGIPGMKVGEKRHIVIPPALGYGDTGSGPIPPNATLEFDVELVTIK